MAGPWDALGQGLSRAAGNIRARDDRDLEKSRYEQLYNIQKHQNELKQQEIDIRRGEGEQDRLEWEQGAPGREADIGYKQGQTDYWSFLSNPPTTELLGYNLPSSLEDPYGEAKRLRAEEMAHDRSIQGMRSGVGGDKPGSIFSIWDGEDLNMEALYSFAHDIYPEIGKDAGIESFGMALSDDVMRDRVLWAIANEASFLKGPYPSAVSKDKIFAALQQLFGPQTPTAPPETGVPAGGGVGAVAAMPVPFSIQQPQVQKAPPNQPDLRLDTDPNGLEMSPTPPSPGQMAPMETNYYHQKLREVEAQLQAMGQGADWMSGIQRWSLERRRKQLREQLGIE